MSLAYGPMIKDVFVRKVFLTDSRDLLDLTAPHCRSPSGKARRLKFLNQCYYRHAHGSTHLRGHERSAPEHDCGAGAWPASDTGLGQGA